MAVFGSTSKIHWTSWDQSANTTFHSRLPEKRPKQLYFSMGNVYNQGRISGLKKVGKMARVPYMCHELSLNNQKRTKQSQKQMRVQLGEIRSYSQLFQTINNKHKTPLVGLITQRSEVQILPPQPYVESSVVSFCGAFFFAGRSYQKCRLWRYYGARLSLTSANGRFSTCLLT